MRAAKTGVTGGRRLFMSGTAVVVQCGGGSGGGGGGYCGRSQCPPPSGLRHTAGGVGGRGGHNFVQ